MFKIRDFLHRRFLVLVILLSTALSLPGILSEYMADDYFFNGALYPPDAPFGYYNFAKKNKAAGVDAWWSSPHLKRRFFRPLSSLSLHLDFTVWPNRPLPGHLHSVLWYILLLIGGYRIFELCLSRIATKWATLLFSIGMVHAWTAGWIAARHAVMGGAFAIWSAYTYLVWRRQGQVRYGIASAGLFLLGLSSSEVALSVLGFALSYEVIFATQPLKRRIRSVAPTVFISLIYLVFYKSMNFGTSGSDAYTDPFTQPGDFFLLLLPKTLSLIGGFIVGIPATLRVLPGKEAVSLGAGIIGLLLLLLGAHLCRSRLDGAEKRALKWLSLMFLFSLFPGIAGITMGREFMLSAIGIAAVTALILTALFSIRESRRKRVLSMAVAVLILAGTLVFSPLSRVGMGYFVYFQSKISREMGASETGCKAGDHVVVLGTGHFPVPVLVAPHIIATYQSPFFRSWHQLTATQDDVTVTRTATDQLLLSSESPLVITTLLREEVDPLEVGQVIDRRPLTIEILEASDAGVTKIIVRFKSPKIIAALCALKTEKATLKPVALPEEGQSITLVHRPYFE